MNFTEGLALAALGYWLFMLLDVLRARRWMFKLPRYAGHPTIPAQPKRSADKQAPSLPPLVSIIIAAKEEESTIADTVKHLLDQTYPRIEIIAVNDRSRDSTGRKLDELRRWSENRGDLHIPVRIIHITSLPSGWIGKNHALYQGYAQARGKYLLFTDADVKFAPNTVSDAVHYLQEEQADHLTLAPRMRMRGFWLKAFVQYFFFTLGLYVRPWRSNDDFQHKHGMGIGAFNLITRHAYERIGTHKALAMRPDDDLQLGRLVKRARLRQRLASGADHIEVEWYATLHDAVRGLEKKFIFRLRLPFVESGAGGLRPARLVLLPVDRVAAASRLERLDVRLVCGADGRRLLAVDSRHDRRKRHRNDRSACRRPAVNLCRRPLGRIDFAPRRHLLAGNVLSAEGAAVHEGFGFIIDPEKNQHADDARSACAAPAHRVLVKKSAQLLRHLHTLLCVRHILIT